MLKLDASALDELAGLANVTVPGYPRDRVGTGIVHFGVGGFHRAHQAMYLDTLMSEDEEALDWGICGVGVMESDRRMKQALESQDGLYTLVLKHPDGAIEARVIGSLVDYLYAPEDPRAVIERMVEERTRIVSLTITEGGYNFDPSTGEFDFDDPGVIHDLSDAPQRTTFGLICAALDARRIAGRAPFTVMSCDNIQGNGDVARKMFLAFARRKSPALAEWMEAEVCFPNAMVDRITPVTTDEDRRLVRETFGIDDAWPVVCEPFTQWVLEDHFKLGRPALERVGVQLVDDVVPYELMKLRLLNASHQALCYFGYLCGYRYAHEVCQDPLFVDFLLGYMVEEATPTLAPVPGVDLDQYRHTLIERFANPAIRDTLARLCAESSDRIPKWLVPVIRERLASGGDIRRSAAVVASWARYAEGVDENGEPIEVVDRLKESLMELAARNREAPEAFIRNRRLFGDLSSDPCFVEAYRWALDSLHQHGARATLESLEKRVERPA